MINYSKAVATAICNGLLPVKLIPQDENCCDKTGVPILAILLIWFEWDCESETWPFLPWLCKYVYYIRCNMWSSITPYQVWENLLPARTKLVHLYRKSIVATTRGVSSFCWTIEWLETSFKKCLAALLKISTDSHFPLVVISLLLLLHRVSKYCPWYLYFSSLRTAVYHHWKVWLELHHRPVVRASSFKQWNSKVSKNNKKK